MQKKYLTRKYQAGADYIPELMSYVVDSPPDGEVLDEVEVYNVQVKQPVCETVENDRSLQGMLKDIYSQHKVKVVILLTGLIIFGYLLGSRR